MKLTPVKIALRSLLFHGKESIYQIAIISILTAIICGSLLTGYSVRSSLKRNLEEKRGAADILISSGIRYFDASLAGRFTEKSGFKCAAIIETNGFCRNFSSGETALDIKINGVDTTFFSLHHLTAQVIKRGSVLVNESLARKLNLNPGDEVILGFSSINPLPSNVPFAPKEDAIKSLVFRVSQIISSDEGGNFSLGSTQSQPLNIFVNIEELEDYAIAHPKANRLLVSVKKNYDNSLLFKYFQQVLTPDDIGLSVRKSQRTGEPEIKSDRIFIDSALVNEIVSLFPSGSPLITYLGNSFDVKLKSTPYSFIAALPSDLLPGIKDDEIIVGRWLAEDLDASPGDTMTLTWFDPGSGKTLRESSTYFVIHSIAENDFMYSDPALMPEFPGISGSTTCSSWDAGVSLNMKKIRKKDEDYWTTFKGTPKAFINYDSGRKLWGNNFGPATEIRFDAGEDTSMIIDKLTGNINPSIAGFSMTDLRTRNTKASSEGVDFGMLFMSLSFFIIVSCIILLSMALKLFLDTRKDEIRTYHAIGFGNRKISSLIFYESFLISVGGALLGSLLGYLVNILIIKALNSIWTGAVQTDTLLPGFNIIPLLTGLTAAIFISAFLIIIRLKYFLKYLAKGSKEIYKHVVYSKGQIPIIFSLLISITLLVLSFIFRNSSTILAFAGGTLLFLVMIMLAYRFFTRRRNLASDYSGLYYKYYPSRAVTPIIFLAAGIFAVMITGANHQVVSEKMELPKGGTGGFLLWAESALPVGYDLNSKEGRSEFGFTEEDLDRMTFVQAGKLRGDDASCLNITHVTVPPIIGIDPDKFMEKGSFSFASSLKLPKNKNPWSLLNENPGDNIIYGIADQTVLEWGLQIKTGDTLKFVSENGQLLDIVICGGLKSSVFQGHLLIGRRSFEKHFPSVAGSSVFLVDGNREMTEFYKSTIEERMSVYGISVEPALERLASFFRVTNTYLDVFMMMGVLGMILGVAGLGFMLVRNFNSRKREFALMIASGYTVKRVRKLLLKDHLLILFWGLLTGSLSSIFATWPSVLSGADLPWSLLVTMLVLILATGYLVLSASVSVVNRKNIIVYLKRE